MGPSGWQILVVLVIILLLFGGRKIPELARGLGEGIKSFKKAMDEGEEGSNKPQTPQVDNQSQMAGTTQTQSTSQSTEKKA
jgi:sec-independent protein translocase protein TatA